VKPASDASVSRHIKNVFEDAELPREATVANFATVRKAEKEFEIYRTHLISGVVTGKIDVRGIIVPEYEAVEDNGEGITGEEEDMAD